MTEQLRLTPNPGLGKHELLAILQKQPNLTPEAVAEAIIANNAMMANRINTVVDSVANDD